MFPILGAALIAVSRTMDYRHHAVCLLSRQSHLALTFIHSFGADGCTDGCSYRLHSCVVLLVGYLCSSCAATSLDELFSHIYFFPLSHHTCHLPYSHRQWLAAAEDEEEDASRHSSSHLLANQGFSHSKHSHSAQSKVPSQPYPNNFAYQQEHQLHPMASHDSV